MAFDPTKPVQTRDGRAARILTTDLKSADYSIVAAYLDGNGRELVNTFTANGSYWSDDRENPMDLVNVPERFKFYVNTGRTTYSQAVAESQSREWPVVELEFEGNELVGSKVVREGKIT